MKAMFTVGVLLAVIAGCGPNGKSDTARPDSKALPGCETCRCSDTAGTVCDTTLDTAAATKPDTPKPPSPPVADKSIELPRLWDFGSEKCIPCQEMQRILTPMMTEYQGKVDIRIINVYEERALAQQFRIVTIPTQVFINAQGKELFRHIGVYPRDSIVAKFKEFGWD